MGVRGPYYSAPLYSVTHLTQADRQKAAVGVRPRNAAFAPLVGSGLVGVLLSLPAMFAPLNLYDGGLASSAATFLLHGALPYRDFWWLYGPGGPVLLAPFVALFGPSLLGIRVAGLVVAFWLTAAGYAWMRAARLTFVLAVLIPATTVGFMSFLNGLEPTTWFIGMAFAISGLYVRVFRRDWAVIAGLLIAAAALTRLDLGAYAFTAALLVPHRARFLATVVGIGLLSAVAALMIADLPTLFEQLIWYPIVGPRQFRGLPLPQISDAITAVAFIVVVLVPKAGVVVAITQMLAGRQRDRALVVLTVFAALCQLQTAGRSDFYHQVQGGFPGTLLLAYTLGRMSEVPLRRMPSIGASRLVGLAVLAAVCGFNLSFSVIALRLPELGRLGPSEQAFVAAVRTISSSSTPDEPIFVALTSNRLTFANDMLAYYLADRRSGVHVAMFNPGVSNTDQVQREMIDDLETSRTRFVLLDQQWADSERADERQRDSGLVVARRLPVERTSLERATSVPSGSRSGRRQRVDPLCQRRRRVNPRLLAPPRSAGAGSVDRRRQDGWSPRIRTVPSSSWNAWRQPLASSRATISA